MAKKIDKELKKEQQIAEGLATIKEARESVDELARRYDEWILQAAELGEDEYSDQLIEDQVELEEFSRNLQFFEVRIRESAVSARAFNKLKSLPRVMDCCKVLLSKGLNLPKIGKQMSDFKDSLDKARTSLKDLRGELSKSKDSVYTDLFGKKKSVDPRIADKVQAKKEQRRIELEKRARQGAVAPVESGVGAQANDDIDTITRLIDEEKKRK